MDIEESDDEGIVRTPRPTVPTRAGDHGAIPATSRRPPTRRSGSRAEADEEADEAVAAPRRSRRSRRRRATRPRPWTTGERRRSPRSSRGTRRPGKKRDRWEPEVRGVVKGKAAKKERKAAAAAAAASSAAANDDDEGLSSCAPRAARRATGVTYAPGNPTKPYQAAHGDEHLGFARPVEAARSPAARLEAPPPPIPRGVGRRAPAPPPKAKASAPKAAPKAKGRRRRRRRWRRTRRRTPPAGGGGARVAAAAAELRSSARSTRDELQERHRKRNARRPYYAMRAVGKQIAGLPPTAEEAALAVARHRAGEASTCRWRRRPRRSTAATTPTPSTK